MKANIQIDFKKINGLIVNKELLKRSPNLPHHTKKTLEKLCKTIEKYFRDYKIIVETKFILEHGI